MISARQFCKRGSWFLVLSWGNSTNNGSQVTVPNIAQQIPKITLARIMKACKILGCDSEFFWKISLSNFLFGMAF